MFAKLGTTPGGIAQILPKRGPLWPISAEFGLTRSKAVDVGPNSADFVATSANIGQTWSGVEQIRFAFDRVRAILSELGPTSRNFGQHRHVVQHCADYDRCLPDSAKCGPEIEHISIGVGQISVDVGGNRGESGQFGSHWANIGHTRPGLD